MRTIRWLSLIATLTLISALFSVAQAQTPRLNSVNITAKSDKIRVAAQGDVSEMAQLQRTIQKRGVRRKSQGR
jgi:hypothetical protein